MVDMIVQKTLPSAVITGEGGLGKSYTVLKSLEKNGFTNITDLQQQGTTRDEARYHELDEQDNMH